MANFAANARTAPTVLTQTLRGSENLLSNRVVVDMQDEIMVYLPEASPLLTLSKGFRKRREAVNARFEWLEQDEYPRTLDVTAAYDSDDTAISITAGQEDRVKANALVQNTRTGELILVLTTSSGSLATVTRGIGGGQSDGIIGDTLLFVGATYEDGADIGTSRSTKEAAYYNYTEITRTAFGFTGRDLETELYGGRDRVTETKKQGVEHKKSLEYKFFFGRRHLITGTHQQTFSDGIDNRIVSNRWDVSGTPLTTRVINEALEDMMKWGDGGNLAKGAGSGTKYLFASSRWLTAFSELGNANLEQRIGDENVGLNVRKYISPHGTVMLVGTPILDYNHRDKAYLVDMNHVRYAYHRGRDTKLMWDRQGNGVDGVQAEYFSDCGLQVELEASHAVWTGISA